MTLVVNLIDSFTLMRKTWGSLGARVTVEKLAPTAMCARATKTMPATLIMLLRLNMTQTQLEEAETEAEETSLAVSMHHAFRE